jgi:hypothetical protein
MQRATTLNLPFDDENDDSLELNNDDDHHSHAQNDEDDDHTHAQTRDDDSNDDHTRSLSHDSREHQAISDDHVVLLDDDNQSSLSTSSSSSSSSSSSPSSSSRHRRVVTEAMIAKLLVEVDASDMEYPQPQQLSREDREERKYDDEADDNDDDGVMLNDELRRVWLEDNNEDAETMRLNTTLCRELMLLRSKSKIPKQHVSDMLQLIHRCCALTSKQKRFIPPDYTHVDKMYKQSRATYVKVH